MKSRLFYSNITGEVFPFEELYNNKDKFVKGELYSLPKDAIVITANDGKRYVDLANIRSPKKSINEDQDFLAEADKYFQAWQNENSNDLIILGENKAKDTTEKTEENCYNKSTKGPKYYFERLVRKANEVVDTTGKKVVAVVVAGSITISGIAMGVAKHFDGKNIDETEIVQKIELPTLNQDILNKVYYINEFGEQVALSPTEIVNHCTIYDKNNPADLFWFDNQLIAQYIKEYGPENLTAVLSIVFADPNMQRYGGEPIYNWQRVCDALGINWENFLRQNGCMNEQTFKEYGEENINKVNAMINDTSVSR